MAKPRVVQADDGELLWFAGGLVNFKVTTEQSDGRFFLMEHRASRGKAAPLHLHPDDDETGYILEGELLMHIDGEEFTAGAGATFYVPRNTPHAFVVVSESVHSIWTVTPGDAIERFFREAGDPAPSATVPAPEIDFGRLKAAGEKTGAMKVLGPPPFAAALTA